MSDFQFLKTKRPNVGLRISNTKRPNVSREVSCKVTRVVEQWLAVIRVMAAVKECILRFQKFFELQFMLAIKKCLHVCMCIYAHVDVCVHIIMYMGIGRFEGSCYA